MQKMIVITAAVVALAGVARAERDFEFPKTDNFPSVSTVKIDMDYGEISLVKATGDGIKVDYKNTVYAKDEAEAKTFNDDVQYTAEVTGDRLVIKVEQTHKSHHDRNIISRIVTGDWSDDVY